MLVLVLAAALQPTPVVPDRQAHATVRILRPAIMRFAEIERREPQRLRTTQLRDGAGTIHPARLVEFE